MIGAAFIALGAGAALAIQAALNGDTARDAGLLPTAAGSLLVGAVLLAALAAGGRRRPTSARAPRSRARSARSTSAGR